MRIGRTLPPAAAPLKLADILSGLAALFCRSRSVTDFEREVATWLGVRHCHAVSSGKAALSAILTVLQKLYPGRDEVLIPAYTCYSVPSAIVRAGMKVRLCDLAQGSFDFDYNAIENMIANPRLLCVVATHLYGIPCDIPRLRTLTRRYGIPVIEDAAQAMGSTIGEKKIGTFGDIALFSLGRGKAFSTVAGGLIATDCDTLDNEIAELLSTTPSCGPAVTVSLVVQAVALWLLGRPGLFWMPRSLPFLKLGETHYSPDFAIMRMSPFQAGLSRRWQERLAMSMALRARNVRRFRDHGVVPHGLSDNRELPLVRLPLMTASTAQKAALLEMGMSKGMGLAEGYPDSIGGIAGLYLTEDANHLPVSRETARLLVTLPVHPYVTQSDIAAIAHLIERAVPFDSTPWVCAGTTGQIQPEPQKS